MSKRAEAKKLLCHYFAANSSDQKREIGLIVDLIIGAVIEEHFDIDPGFKVKLDALDQEPPLLSNVKHTAREIVNQAIIRWEVSLADIQADSYDHPADTQRLEQWIIAGQTILEDFTREGL
jgi:hypothetical protein